MSSATKSAGSAVKNETAGDIEMGMTTEITKAPRRHPSLGDKGQDARDDFSTGLVDCFAEPDGAKLCAITCFLPCVTLGWNNAWLKYWGDASFAGAFLFGCLLYPFSFILTAKQNMELKRRLNIGKPDEDDACSSMCTAFFCNCCMLMQTRREQLLHDARCASKKVPMVGHKII